MLKFLRSPWTIILLISVGLFVFWGGPVFTARSLSHGGRLLVSYTFIPLAVLVVLLVRRTWSWWTFLYYTIGIAMIKMLLTMSIHIWAQPRDAGHQARPIKRQAGDVAPAPAYDPLPALIEPARIHGQIPNVDPSVTTIVALIGIHEGKAIRRQARHITLRNAQLTPALLAVSRGDTLRIANQDAAFHTLALGNSANQLFQMPLPPGRTAASRPVSRSGLFHSQCSYNHQEEQLTLLVFDHPYHTSTGPDGRFALDSIPAGEYRIGIWYSGDDGISLDKPTVSMNIDLRSGEDRQLEMTRHPVIRAPG